LFTSWVAFEKFNTVNVKLSHGGNVGIGVGSGVGAGGVGSRSNTVEAEQAVALATELARDAMTLP